MVGYKNKTRTTAYFSSIDMYVYNIVYGLVDGLDNLISECVLSTNGIICHGYCKLSTTNLQYAYFFIFCCAA